MSDVDSNAPTDDARETLERLYDDPDEEIPELLDHRADEDAVESQYPVFRALANEDRLRLLDILRNGERCGCELMVLIDAPQSTVATHLRKLREAGLVTSRKKGKWNYYRIADAAVMDVLDLAVAVRED
ncbi:ArsR/SmtB family transcription factor [Halorussus amylolyticus]|uniref:ArsR/SmtB family transcription factor n=1 Tax=Halorussus amylolyticus TaxID=1126242 RepID=UPI001052C40A|nr:metalloregulator ArsR/SmtB family transcription factor [Halorussus amylolyticus]